MRSAREVLFVPAAATLVLGLICAPAAIADGNGDGAVAQPEAQGVAELLEGDALQWKPRVEFERLVLTVTGALDGFQKEFAKDDRVILRPLYDGGKALADGSYTYELRAVPKLSPEVRKTLSAAAPAERGEVLRELRRSGKLAPRAWTQSGTFTIKDGRLVDPQLAERAGGLR